MHSYHNANPDYRRERDAKLSPADLEIVMQARRARLQRKLDRKAMAAAGLKPVRIQRVHRVELAFDAQIPQWARKHAIQGFSKDQHVAWFKHRWVANDVRDELAGTARITNHDAYQCPACRRWVIGMDAKDLAARVEEARKKRFFVDQFKTIEPITCGVRCQAVAA